MGVPDKVDKKNLEIYRFGEDTHSSPAKRRRASEYNMVRELGGGGLPGSPRGSRRRRPTSGATTPTRRPATPACSRGARPGREREKSEHGLKEGPPGPPNSTGAPPPAWTGPAPRGPSLRPPSMPGPGRSLKTESGTWQSMPPTPAPPGCRQPGPSPQPSTRPSACPPILEICKLWERGPLEREEISSSSSSSSAAKIEKKLENIDEMSGREIRKKAERKSKEESSKKIQKKEDEDLKERRKKKKKISEDCTYMPRKRIAYLVGEGEDEESCALPGTARTARTASPSSGASLTSSARSTEFQASLPPADRRSSSPDFRKTYGSTLCAHYRQHTAEFVKREDDRVSRADNVCGPITACRLADREKVRETSGYQGN